MNNNLPPQLKDYVPVNERLAQFWLDHPNGRVITVIVGTDPIVVRAEVYREGEDQPMASGHATDDGGMRNGARSDSYEKTETAAVGRALALAGYEIKKAIASREEMEKFHASQEPPTNGKPQENTPKQMMDWLVTIGVKTKDQYNDYKAWCQSKQLGWLTYAIEARTAGVTTVDGLYAYTDTGVAA